MGKKDEARLNSTGKHPNTLQPKDNSFRSQLQTIFHYLIGQVVSASQVLSEAQVPIRPITCHKRDLAKDRKFWEVVKEKCRVSGFKVWFLTIDHENARSLTNQLTLWL